MARKLKARLEAMSKKAPTQAQLDYLKALGEQAVPAHMAEASERIETLKAALEAKRSNAPGGTP
jgi:hypothetical protein